MDRLKKIGELERLEETKVVIENVLTDMSNFYFEQAYITINLQTRDFNHKHEEFDKSLKIGNARFEDYLKKELEDIKAEIKLILGELQND